MAVTQIYSAVPNDVITAARWNNEFGNIYNNGTDIAFPLTKAVSFAGFTITLDSAGASTISSTSSQAISFTPGAKSGTPNTTGKALDIVANTFTDSATAGSGTATAFAANAIQRPTLAATNTLVTTTDAATLYIANSPAAGTNETITNPWSIWVDAGNVRFDGGLTLAGTLALSGIITGGGATTTQAGTVELLTQAEYDAATDTTRVPTSNLNRIVLAAVQATTSGTSFTFGSIPAGTRRIVMMFRGVSLSGTNNFLVQIGDAGGIETSGYVSTSGGYAAAGVGVSASTAAFIIRGAVAAGVHSGVMVLELMDAANFVWISHHTIKNSTTVTGSGGGDKALSAELTQVQLSADGADTFDAGSVAISYER